MAYDMDAALPSAEIHWSVPKFDVDSNLELTDALKALVLPMCSTSINRTFHR